MKYRMKTVIKLKNQAGYMGEFGKKKGKSILISKIKYKKIN